MLVLGIVVGAVALSGWRFSAKWLVFGSGLLVFAVFDSIYLVEIAKNTYVDGTSLDLGWPAGILLIAGAGTLPSRRVRAAQLDGYRLILVPALFGVVALVLEIVDHFQTLNHARDRTRDACARRCLRAHGHDVPRLPDPCSSALGTSRRQTC